VSIRLSFFTSGCLFRRATGVACPGCGLTRAFFALGRGEWSEAIRLHPLAPFLLLEAAVLFLMWAARLLPLTRSQLERWAERLILANGALFILVWCVRLYFNSLPV